MKKLSTLGLPALTIGSAGLASAAQRKTASSPDRDLARQVAPMLASTHRTPAQAQAMRVNAARFKMAADRRNVDPGGAGALGARVRRLARGAGPARSVVAPVGLRHEHERDRPEVLPTGWQNR